MTDQPDTTTPVVIHPDGQVVAMPDGTRLAVFVYRGEVCDPDATPVLMLHGNGGNHGSFWAIASAIAAERLVIAPDMRGQGVSEAGTATLSYELLADDAAHVLAALGATRAVVLGYSDGGIEALLLARDHADSVAGIVTMGANLTPDGLVADEGTGMVDDEALYRSLAGKLPAAGRQADLLRLMIDEPQIEESSLASVSCPATVMAGEFDVIAPEETDRIVAAIPDARKVIVPAAGHGLMRDAPATVEAELRRLLKQVDGSR